MYVLLLLVFGAAGLTTLGYLCWNNLPREIVDFVADALVGAVGTVASTTLVDAADDYFSPPGIGRRLPAFGLMSGALFGVAFRSIYGSVSAGRPTQR